MITIHNFNKAYQQYSNQNLSYRLLQDQAVVLMGLCNNKPPTYSNPLNITQLHINWLLQQPEAMYDYGEYLGGCVYVCETEGDLLQIHGCNFKWAETHNGNWPNVTDIAMSWDACNYLEESSGNPQWVMFLMCWNNAGGPVYYVPKQLWEKARVAEHIQATNPT